MHLRLFPRTGLKSVHRPVLLDATGRPRANIEVAATHVVVASARFRFPPV